MITSVRTIHIVALPTILTCGVGGCKRKTNRNNTEPFRILVLRQRLSIRLDALRRRHVRETSNLRDPFVVKAFVTKKRCRHTHVHASARYPPARASAHCAAQHVATPTMSILNFCEENFHDQKSNHEIHENIVPRKFGAIRYPIKNLGHLILLKLGCH